MYTNWSAHTKIKCLSIVFRRYTNTLYIDFSIWFYRRVNSVNMPENIFAQTFYAGILANVFTTRPAIILTADIGMFICLPLPAMKHGWIVSSEIHNNSLKWPSRFPKDQNPIPPKLLCMNKWILRASPWNYSSHCTLSLHWTTLQWYNYHEFTRWPILEVLSGCLPAPLKHIQIRYGIDLKMLPFYFKSMFNSQISLQRKSIIFTHLKKLIMETTIHFDISSLPRTELLYLIKNEALPSSISKP